MSCKVIQLNIERWVNVFEEGGVTVYVSTKGNVKFDTKDKNELNLQQVFDLACTLARAFGDDNLDQVTKS